MELEPSLCLWFCSLLLKPAAPFSWIDIKHWCISRNVSREKQNNHCWFYNTIFTICFVQWHWKTTFIRYHGMVTSSLDVFEDLYGVLWPWNPMDLHIFFGNLIYKSRKYLSTDIIHSFSKAEIWHHVLAASIIYNARGWYSITTRKEHSLAMKWKVWKIHLEGIYKMVKRLCKITV